MILWRYLSMGARFGPGWAEQGEGPRFSPRRTPRAAKDAQRMVSDDETPETILWPGSVEIHEKNPGASGVPYNGRGPWLRFGMGFLPLPSPYKGIPDISVPASKIPLDFRQCTTKKLRKGRRRPWCILSGA